MDAQIYTNREHKDRLFCFLFGREQYKQNALDLYNAVNGTHYEDKDSLEFNTIGDAVYMGMKNDVSFLFQDDMSLYEHQSTFCPNMPVRGLMYVGRLMDKYIKANRLNVYGKTRLELPTPRYVVFYNGTDDMPERTELRLSDSFKGKGACVEMVATVYNVNKGKNDGLLRACKALGEYAEFIAKVREHCKVMDARDAIDKAVDECIRQGVLRQVLEEHKTEVIGMLLTEYDEAATMEAIRQEAEKIGEANIAAKILRDLADGMSIAEVNQKYGEIAAASSLAAV